MILSATIWNVPSYGSIQFGIDHVSDSDTVLVMEGTYYENIDFLGKAITVASHFLIDGDPSHIENTIINGSEWDYPNKSVVYFTSGEDTTSVLCGFTLTEGAGTVLNNGDYYYSIAGGINIEDSSPTIIHNHIIGNDADYGAGIYGDNSNAYLENLTITNNIGSTLLSRDSGGGGIYLLDSNPTLINVTISDNSITHNGGGIFLLNSESLLKGVSISNNLVEECGGGIYFSNSYPQFDQENRCNIFQNNTSSDRGSGADLYAVDCNTIDVIIDTFTVQTPTDYFASPIDNFTFDIQHGIEELIDADLYVSPDGDNSNSGLTPDQPLKTIYYAITHIQADSQNPRTIYLAPGTYGHSFNDEQFPLYWTSYVNLEGAGQDLTILDAENLSRIFNFYDINNFSVRSLAIINGDPRQNYNIIPGGGILCQNSDITFENLEIINNISAYGGGIYCNNSNLTIQNSLFSGNYVSNNRRGGGIYCSENSNLFIENSIFQNNYANSGGGLYCENTTLNCQSVTFVGNNAESGGGLELDSGVNANLNASFIINNTASESGGGIYLNSESEISLEDVDIFSNSAASAGGIYSQTGNVTFSSENRCDIYANTSVGYGKDLVFSENVEVIVDTFSVLYPSNYYAFPNSFFYFDIQNGYYSQIDADLYVSPQGNDENDGLTPETPLRTVYFAFSKIIADSLNERTINLLPGSYHDVEPFPIYACSFVSLIGDDPETTFIEPLNQAIAISYQYVEDSSLKHLSVVNCGGIEINSSSLYISDVAISENQKSNGGGIQCIDSALILESSNITDNTATGYYGSWGGGIYFSDSEVKMNDVLIENNTGSHGAGIRIHGDEGEYTIYNSTITGNSGIGIKCSVSNSIFDEVIISENTSTGINFVDSNPIIRNSSVFNNNGSGIWCESADAEIENTIISNNSGRGIYCFDNSSPLLDDVTISGNSGSDGGGIFCSDSSPVLGNTIIINNLATENGGAIYCSNSQPSFSNVTISHNSALNGGGIYFEDNTIPIFSNENRCNIYLNSASQNGCDLFETNCPTIDVIVDTFTVIQPDEQFAYPLDNFTFDILNRKIEQVSQDLFVSPTGSDDNNGFSPDDPLQTISCALLMILSVETNPHSIYLANGTYSFSQTGESFPLNCKSYISLIGENEESTILDGEGIRQTLNCYEDSFFSIENLTIINSSGAGIYCDNYSSPDIENVTISFNAAGGLRCYNNSNPSLENVTINNNILTSYNNTVNGAGIGCVSSSPDLSNVLIADNTAGNSTKGGGIACSNNSNPVLDNVTISDNLANSKGGGIYCDDSNPILHNVMITDNSVISNNYQYEGGGGIYCDDSNPILQNVTITNNSVIGNANYAFGGGIYCRDSGPIFQNVKFLENSATGDGGALFLDNSDANLLNVLMGGNSSDNNGGAIYNTNSSLLVMNSTIIGNSAADGGAIYGGYSFIINSILWNNLPNEITGIYDMHYSDMQDCGGNGTDYDLDPIFVDPENGDFHLSDQSPLINAGILEIDDWTAPDFDIEGNPRPNPAGSMPDLGAYENPLGQAQNTTVYVSTEGSDETGDGSLENPFATIQHGLSMVYFRWKVLVMPGEYFENLNFNGRNATIQSVEGFENTIINGDQVGSVITFMNDETSDAVLDGFTIKNGYNEAGGGINCFNSQPVLKNLLIKENEAITGAGICCMNSDIVLQNVVIADNISTDVSGGFHCLNSTPILTNVTISGNSAEIGGGIYCVYNANPVLVNCILWNNSPQEIGFNENADPNSITITYSDIEGGEAGIETNDNGFVTWLEGNIDQYPLFITGGDFPFSLLENSPCIDTGTPEADSLNLPEFDLSRNLRIYNERIDMGAYEYNGVLADEDLIPAVTSLNKNYPNPFNPTTTISFNISNEQNEQIELAIYNLKGQKVKHHISDQISAGRHSVIWNGKDDYGKTVASGVYFYRLKTGDFDKTKKMILLR